MQYQSRSWFVLETFLIFFIWYCYVLLWQNLWTERSPTEREFLRVKKPRAEDDDDGSIWQRCRQEWTDLLFQCRVLRCVYFLCVFLNFACHSNKKALKRFTFSAWKRSVSNSETLYLDPSWEGMPYKDEKNLGPRFWTKNTPQTTLLTVWTPAV